jgi:hypothetical protein
MAQRDLLNHIHTVAAIPPVAARTNNTAIASSIIDTLGYDSLTFVIVLGTNTDTNATFAVTMEHGDNSALSDTAVPAATDLVGTTTLASFTYADDTETRKLGYIGNKRYVRMTITPTGNDSGDIFVAAVAVLGHAHIEPTANPPQ